MKNFKEKITNFIIKYKYYAITTLVVALVAILDLTTKALTDGKFINIISNVFTFTSSHNTGAAWSILYNHTWLLIVLSVVFVLAILVANLLYTKKSNFYSIGLGLVLGGAICNLLDRLFFGYVRDFISLEFIKFPIFNLADCAITAGVILLCIHLLFLADKKPKTNEIVVLQQDKNVEENLQPQENKGTKTKKQNTKPQKSVVVKKEEQPQQPEKSDEEKPKTARGGSSNKKKSTKSATVKKQTTSKKYDEANKNDKDQKEKKTTPKAQKDKGETKPKTTIAKESVVNGESVEKVEKTKETKPKSTNTKTAKTSTTRTKKQTSTQKATKARAKKDEL